MTGKPHAIPTVYKGVQFRSRIEAKWAAMFDALKWEWEYEPIDLAGYIPDFILPFRHAPLLVEVKATSGYQVRDELKPHTQKIADSEWTGEAWIVGSKLGDVGPGDMLAGILGSRENVAGQREWLWDDACLAWCTRCHGPMVMQFNHSWRCRRCGADERIHRGFTPELFFSNAWVDAGNAVQWKGPKA